METAVLNESGVEIAPKADHEGIGNQGNGVEVVLKPEIATEYMVKFEKTQLLFRL